MENKRKLGFVALVTVMALVIISLTIGIVLVAGRVIISNSMVVIYKANNVEATIVSSAKLYSFASDANPSVIKLSGGQEVLTQNITTDTEEVEFTSFEDAKLKGFGYAVYTFAITNNNMDINIPKNIVVDAGIYVQEDGVDNNITSVIVSSTISIDENFKNAILLTSDKNNLDDLDITIIEPGQTVYYTVVLSVTDHKADAKLNANVVINLTSVKQAEVQ